MAKLASQTEKKSLKRSRAKNEWDDDDDDDDEEENEYSLPHSDGLNAPGQNPAFAPASTTMTSITANSNLKNINTASLDDPPLAKKLHQEFIPPMSSTSTTSSVWLSPPLSNTSTSSSSSFYDNSSTSGSGGSGGVGSYSGGVGGEGSSTHSGPLSPDHESHNLPVHLYAAGWRKHWSNREKREYYFNKKTGVSKWDLCELEAQQSHHHVDPYTDPLGISTPHHHHHQQHHQQQLQQQQQQPPQLLQHSISVDSQQQQQLQHQPLQQRHYSLDSSTSQPTTSTFLQQQQQQQQQQSMVKKVIAYSGSPFWDFSVQSGASLAQPMQDHPCYLHPHAEVEVMRGLMVAKLRQNYQDLCSHREGIDAPMESFNRWLLERATVDKGIDPLLPSQCSVPLSSSMFREVINDVPIRLSRPRRCEDARRMLSKYAEAAKSLVMKRGCNVDSRKTVAWHADDTFSFMQKRGNATYDDYMDRLAHVKRECQPHVIEAAKSSVEGICLKVYSLSCVYVKKIYDKHLSVLSAAGVDVKTLPGPTSSSSLLLPHSLTNHHRYPCSPIALSTPPSPNVTVEHHDSGEVVTLRLKLAAVGVANNDVMKINSMHFRKLEQLYMLNCRDDPKMEHFLHRTWCLLKRYNTFFGTKENEGFGLQGALPVSVFQCLNRSFGVTFECFASPLNCYFKQFCSAFPDTDGYFGSRGSVLDFYPISGSFEANPPFNEELMEAMVDHFESLLSETPLPLSFIIFLPDWKDPPTEALIKLESSRYKRQQMTIPAMEHEYRHGFQHICQRKDLNVRSLHGTLVIFLQNDAGANKWSVNNDNMRELLYAYQLNNNNNNNNGPTN